MELKNKKHFEEIEEKGVFLSQWKKNKNYIDFGVHRVNNIKQKEVKIKDFKVIRLEIETDRKQKIEITLFTHNMDLKIEE